MNTGCPGRNEILLVIFLFGTAVFFLAVLAAVNFFFLIRQEEYLIQLLLNGGDTSGILAVDDIHQLLGESQVFLFHDLSVPDDIDCDIVIDKAQNIQIQLLYGAFYLDDVLSSHLIAAGVFDDGNAAVHLVQLQIFIDIHGFSGLDLHEMNLYPCAYSMTFNVTKEPGREKLVLNAVLNQRSQDVLTANNWNVVQYSLLLMMMAQSCGMEAGELLHVIADAHIYDRHIPLVKELIGRRTYPAPRVWLNPQVKDFYDFTVDDLHVENYEAGPQIKNIPVAV